MSRGIDFIETNLAHLVTIVRPTAKAENKNERKNHPGNSVEVKKSFAPEQKSSIHKALRPEIQKLKQAFIKSQRKEVQEKLAKPQKEPDGSKLLDQTGEHQEKVTIDSSGVPRDQEGNPMFVKNRTTDLVFNRKKEEERQMKDFTKKPGVKLTQQLGKVFLDRNLVVGSSKRRIRRSMLGLQFLDKGSYQTKEQRTEVKEQIQSLNDVFEAKGQEIKVIKQRRKVNLQFNRQVPTVQWWDRDLLEGNDYGVLQTSNSINSEKSNIVPNAGWFDLLAFNQISGECQYQKVGEQDTDQRVIFPMFLTKQERKKLKRKRKQEKLLEKNDKIKLGLIQPEKPKLRIGNMAVVMKNQFVLDPSRVQAEAKKQTEERINKHIESNSSKKLTKNQKKDKAIRKLKRDSAKQCRRVVFKVNKIVDPTHLFKVNMNAKQLALNGLVIKPSSEFASFPTMILIEGGQRAVKFYKNLMMRRIKWSQDPLNDCQLVWQGEIDNSTSGKWRMHEVNDEVQGIRLLTQKKLQHFWEYMSSA